MITELHDIVVPEGYALHIRICAPHEGEGIPNAIRFRLTEEWTPAGESVEMLVTRERLRDSMIDPIAIIVGQLTEAIERRKPSFDHSKSTRREWIPGGGGCVCKHCKLLPDYEVKK